MEHDPILDELWGGEQFVDGEVAFDGPYGVGTWPDAVLMDVQTIQDHQYGYRVGLVFNLKGDTMKYTGRLNLPQTVEENGDHDRYERALKAVEGTRDTLAGLLLGADLIPQGKKPGNVDNDDQYERICNVFRHGVGRNMPIKVSVQRKFNKATEKWEATDFTEIKAIRPRKKG